MAINLLRIVPKVQNPITSKPPATLFFTRRCFPSFSPVALAVCSMSYEKELAAAKKAASLAARLCQAILSFYCVSYSICGILWMWAEMGIFNRKLNTIWSVKPWFDLNGLFWLLYDLNPSSQFDRTFPYPSFSSVWDVDDLLRPRVLFVTIPTIDFLFSYSWRFL